MPGAHMPPALLRRSWPRHSVLTRGLEVAAGHGLNRHNVGPVVAIPEVSEVNIGHSVISDALFSVLTVLSATFVPPSTEVPLDGQPFPSAKEAGHDSRPQP